MHHERYRHMHGHSMSSMKKASFKVALKDKKQIAEGTWAFVFEKPNGFNFKAGQHIRLTLINPSETDREGDSRFFSLASTPQELDLVIAMRMRDTAFKRVLKNMPVGEKVLIQILQDVPHGAFALHDDASKTAVFLAGGIGIVPAYSMVKNATKRKLPHRLFLFYSNRRPEDAPFLADLQDLAKQNPNFTLTATMTEPEKSARVWQGESGFINPAMLKRYVKDLQSPIYYISGLPEMTSAMKAMLTDLGVSEENMRAEEFTGFNLNEIQNVPSHAGKRYFLLAAIALMIIAAVIVHASTAVSAFNNGVSLKNPILYVMIGFSLVLVTFKLKHVLSLKHWKKK